MKRTLVGTALATLLLAGCDATINGGTPASTGGAATFPGAQPGGGGTGSSSTGGLSPGTGGIASGDPNAVGERPLTRLTRREYNNTVRDLLGDTTRPADKFPDDRDRTFLFRRSGLVATQDAELLRSSAETLAASALSKLDRILPCTPAADETGCATRFIDEFGLRAFRRPLTADEKSGLQALYQTARGSLGLGFNEAIGVLLEQMLQSPPFLYHWESPQSERKLEAGAVKLDAYDLASRLSYFIWGSLPDQVLFDAAAAGRLETAEEVTAQAQRMFQDEKAQTEVAAFFAELLELDELAEVPKDAATYPDYTPAVGSALQGANTEFVKNVLTQTGGKLETLLTADFSLSNQALNGMYAGAQRSGLLTQPGFLSATGAADGSHPVKRGKAVYTKVLCGDLPPPPANVPSAQPASAGGTTRDRFATHAQNPCARGCHMLMDPFGFAFEHYDGIGRYRTLDNGLAVDSASQASIDGRDQSFADAFELSRILATSDTVRSCMTKQWLRFAFKRAEGDSDAPSLTSIGAAFASHDYLLRDLLPAIAASRSFRYRAPAQGEVIP